MYSQSIFVESKACCMEEQEDEDINKKKKKDEDKDRGEEILQSPGHDVQRARTASKYTNGYLIGKKTVAFLYIREIIQHNNKSFNEFMMQF